VDETELGDAKLEQHSEIGVGSRVADRYDVQVLLGTGAMGSVYRVWDSVVGQVVALKLLSAMSSPEALEGHRREVRLARRVTHRNIARIHDLGDHGERCYLTMEYVDGPNLREWVRERGRPGMRMLLDVGRQIAEGLNAAHEAGVVHRDLKPANILIEPSGRVVIADFGIAWTHEGKQPDSQLVGTPAYMAPEQVIGGEIGPGTDLYALGLILFELTTGETPLRRSTPLATALARLDQPLMSLDGVPDLLVPLLGEMLVREPEHRLSDAARVVERLRALVDTLTDSNPTNAELISPRDRGIAVLPFRHRGPADQRYISEALGDELIDVLTTMRGLRVSASGATARFVESDGGRDPRAIGRELGVELVVDATATVAGSRIQIAARLLDVASNSQLWSERYDSNLTDVFELQDKLGKRIGEALRLEIEHLTHRQLVPDAAIDVYLRARASSRESSPAGVQQTVELFERCLELAPGFRPALAGYAIACLRRWFGPDGGRDWAEVVNAAVDAARIGAGELAETHLAIAMLAVQQGDYRAAATALQQALQIAPTYAAAHDYLGRLQLEAGRPERGIRHTQLAWELNPSLLLCLRDLSRYHALRGDREQFQRWWAEIERTCPDRHPIYLQEHRIATWFRDADWAARVFARLADARQSPEVLGLMATYHRADLSEAELREALATNFGRAVANPRLRSLLCQIYCEAASWHAFDALALEYLSKAADGVLVDLDWLDHCPLLDRLRERDEFVRARMIVADRADAIWAG
jgi:TolB-like protein/predicted Ser/Thr protein kinase